MIVAKTLEGALKIASAMRELRDADMEDARRWRDVFGRATDPAAREFIRRHVGQYVANARKWNRQMLCAQRAIKRALLMRQLGVRGTVDLGVRQ